MSECPCGRVETHPETKNEIRAVIAPCARSATKTEVLRMENRCSEIVILHEMLKEVGIDHVFREIHGSFQLVYPTLDAWDNAMRRYMSAPRKVFREDMRNAISVIPRGDRLEIMGMLTDEEFAIDDIAYTTAENVFARIVEKEKGKRDPWLINDWTEAVDKALDGAERKREG